MKPYAALLASALFATLPLAGQTPVDPKSPIPGYPDGRGPKGPVSVKIVSPSVSHVITATATPSRRSTTPGQPLSVSSATSPSLPPFLAMPMNIRAT